MNTDVAVTPALSGCPAVDDTSPRTTVATTSTDTADRLDRTAVTELGPRRWAARAACLGADCDLFFAPVVDLNATRAARAYCRSCPVQVDCLDYALATEQRDGIWGNTDPRQRRQLARQAA